MPRRLDPHPDPEVEAARERKREANRRYYRTHAKRLRVQERRYRKENAEKIAARRLTEDLVCPICEQPFRGRKGQVTCSKACRMRQALADGTIVPQKKFGPDSHFWRGGRSVNRRGYVDVWVPPETPGRNKDTGRMPEHRFVMQQHLGRPLQSFEHIHHRNGVKHDNRLENLEIVTRTPHTGEVVCPHCGTQFAIR